MGKVILDEKQVTITNEIELVINCYRTAQIEAGFNDQTLDSRLAIDSPQLKSTSLINQGKAIASKAFERQFGQNHIILPPITLILTSQTDSFYQLYYESWIKAITTVFRSKWSFSAIDAPQITDKKIVNHHVFIMHLCFRLFAYSLQIGEDMKVDTGKYHFFLDNFTKKLIVEQQLLILPRLKSRDIQLDAVGLYLAGIHKHNLAALKQLLNSNSLFNSHRNAIVQAENLLKSIATIVTQQLIAYIDPNIKYEALDPNLCFYTFQKLQEHIVDKLKIRNNVGMNLALTFDNDELPYKQGVLRYLSNFSKKNCNLDKIKSIYSLLEQVRINRSLVAEVGNFIAGTGWLGILTGHIKLGALNQRLEKYFQNAAKILAISPEFMSTAAGGALARRGAANLQDLSIDSAKMSEHFQRLDDPAFLEWVKDQIGGNLRTLVELQQKHEIEIIDMSLCNSLLQILPTTNRDNTANSNQTANTPSFFITSNTKEKSAAFIETDLYSHTPPVCALENPNTATELVAPVDITAIDISPQAEQRSMLIQIEKLIQIASNKAEELRTGWFWYGTTKAEIISKAVRTARAVSKTSCNNQQKLLEVIEILDHALRWHRILPIGCLPTRSSSQLRNELIKFELTNTEEASDDERSLNI